MSERVVSECVFSNNAGCNNAGLDYAYIQPTEAHKPVMTQSEAALNRISKPHDYIEVIPDRQHDIGDIKDTDKDDTAYIYIDLPDRSKTHQTLKSEQNGASSAVDEPLYINEIRSDGCALAMGASDETSENVKQNTDVKLTQGSIGEHKVVRQSGQSAYCKLIQSNINSVEHGEYDILNQQNYVTKPEEDTDLTIVENELYQTGPQQ